MAADATVMPAPAAPPGAGTAPSADQNTKAAPAAASGTTPAAPGAAPAQSALPILPATPPPAADSATGRNAAAAPAIPPAPAGAKSARGQSEDAPDLTLSAAGATPADAPAASANTQSGAAIQPTFNPAMPAGIQPAPALGPTAPHIAATAEAAVPVANLPVEIATRVEAGQKHFEIRLDPPSLGRIEVQLSVDSSGRATSHIVADRADTFDLLRRDAPALERALQSAGLTTDDGALQFSLRDQSFAGRDQGAPAPLAPPVQPVVADTEVAPVDAALRRYGQLMGLGGGIDIRV
jgi:flagellar hook-length control protein FliK